MDKIHDIFKCPVERSNIDEEVLKNYLNFLKSAKNNKIRKLFYRLIYPISYWNLNNKRSFLFADSRLYSDIIKGEYVKNNSFLFSGLRSSLLAAKHFIPFYIFYEHIAEIYELYMNDPLLISKNASTLINKTIKIMKSVSPKFLLLASDCLFVERFLIYCAREAGIKSICIQHGIFLSRISRFLDGKYADYMFLWGDSQANIYKNNEFDMKKIRIIGYPYNIVNSKNRISDKKKVCILGQPYETYRAELGNRKKIIFKELINILENNGFKVSYKPHPGEKNFSFYPSNVNLYKRNLKHALSEFDVFIALDSTALLEASIYGKIAIQLFDENFESDHFAKLGYSYEYPATDLKNIPNFIISLDKAYNVPKSSILLNNNVSKRFLDILKTI